MSTAPTSILELPRLIADGLVLRRSTPADADRLAEFDSRIHSDDKPDPFIGSWVRNLFSGVHPTFQPEDFLIVENLADGKIVSSSNLISQTWSYGGIKFGVGRPELIGTEPAYRRRGLVRAQMDVLHAWCKERGEMVQAITGIPNYYRQFGYEMTVNLDCGRHVHYVQYKPLADGQTEPYTIRPAESRDIPLLMECYQRVESCAALTCVRTAREWQYELTGKDLYSADRVDLFIIENPDHLPVGAFGVKAELWGDGLAVQFYGLLPGNSYLMVTPSVLRFIWKRGMDKMEPGKTCRRLTLLFGEQHPAYAALDSRTLSPVNPYTFFMRVPDLAGFLRHIAPVLEQRLAESPCSGHSGTLNISFYRSGLRLTLDKGSLTEIIETKPEDWAKADASFPDLTFFQLLFQGRSLDQLREAYTDVSAKLDACALLNAMFPRSPSAVWVIS